MPPQSTTAERKGAIATIAAFAFWGIVPIYWKAVEVVPPHEMIAHRIVWALPILAVIVWMRGEFPSVKQTLRTPRLLGFLAISASLIGVNWFIFIQAVAAEKVLETSLGYFINPLVNVLLGFVILKERLLRLQWIAVTLAALGVLNLVLRVGTVPWIALSLAITFGLYGLVRKKIAVDALAGLFVEVLYIVPIALTAIVMMEQAGTAAFSQSPTKVQLLVPVAGLITALPLWWFSYGARRIRYVTVGLIQFLAPTGQFLLAIFLFGEPFTAAHGLTFALIWCGVLLYLFAISKRS